MKIDFKQTFKEFDGKIVQDENQKDLTLKAVSLTALQYLKRDEPVSGEEKVSRYKTGLKIFEGEADLEAEEISKLKKLIGEVFGVVVVAQAHEMLEGKTKK